MSHEFDITESNDLNRAIEEFVTAMKAMFAEEEGGPSIWMVVGIRGHYEWLRIPGSEKAFLEDVTNRKRRIQLLVKAVFGYIKQTEGPVELKAVVAVSDAYFTVHQMEEEHKTLTPDEHIKRIVDAPDYVEPRHDPKHIEAFLINFCFKDSNNCFMYEYERKDNKISFTETNLLSGLEMGGGAFTKLYPQDL